MANSEDEKPRVIENLSQLFDAKMADFFTMSQICDDENISNRLRYI